MVKLSRNRINLQQFNLTSTSAPLSTTPQQLLIDLILYEYCFQLYIIFLTPVLQSQHHHVWIEYLICIVSEVTATKSIRKDQSIE